MYVYNNTVQVPCLFNEKERIVKNMSKKQILKNLKELEIIIEYAFYCIGGYKSYNEKLILTLLVEI